MSESNNRATVTAYPASAWGKENVAVRPSCCGLQHPPSSSFVLPPRQPSAVGPTTLRIPTPMSAFPPIPTQQAAWTMQPAPVYFLPQNPPQPWARTMQPAPSMYFVPPQQYYPQPQWAAPSHQAPNGMPFMHRSEMPHYRPTSLEYPPMSALPPGPNPKEVQLVEDCSMTIQETPINSTSDKRNIVCLENRATFPCQPMSVLPPVRNPKEVQLDDNNMRTDTIVNGNKAYSEQDLVFLDTLRTHFYARFPPGGPTIWESPKALRAAVQKEADMFGFTVSHTGSSLRCARYTAPLTSTAKRSELDVPESKRRKTDSYRCNCPFIMRWSEQKIQGALTGRIRLSLNCVYQHANGCLPCPVQKVTDAVHSVTFNRDWPTEEKLESIIEISRSSTIDSKMLCRLLKPLMPQDAPIDASFLSNIRLKVKRILEQRDAQGYYLSARPDAWLGSNEHARLQDRAPYIDEASRQAATLLKQVQAEGSSSDAEIMLSYLKKLHEVEPGFSFRINYDTDHKPCGYVWQTPAMRAAFEQFGGVLFLAMMKQQSNSLNWPYCGLTLMDGDKKITVACESIVCAENLESYQFIVEACLDMAPQRTRESLKVVFGNGILSDKLLPNLGISDTCKLVLDWHRHVKDWRKHFGAALYATLSDALKALMSSPTVDAYSTNHAYLLSLLSGKHEAQKVYVEREIHKKRFYFVRAFVTQHEENLGKLGDQGQGPPANHSSYGKRIGINSNTEIAVQLQQTLGRQIDINNERSRDLYVHHAQCMATACALVSNANATEHDRQKARAILHLSSQGFLKWQKSLEGANELIKKELPHNQGDLPYCEISRSGHENSAPRKICLDPASGQGRCMCVERIADLRQCSHEIKAYDGKFVPALWSGRWTQRKTVEASYNTPPSTGQPFVTTHISNIAQPTTN